MTGQPQLGTNPAFGIDARDILVTDNDQIPSNLILVSTERIEVSVTFEVDGGVLPIFDNQPFRVVYAFSSLTGAAGFQASATGNLRTTPAPAKKIYDGTDTRAQVPAGTLTPGLYQLSAMIQLPNAPSVAAFVTLPVIEVI